MSDQYLPTYIDKVDNSISIMDNENAISYYKNNGDINTISAKNIAHKKLDDNLNLCAFDGSNFNSVISINNSNSNCEINNILKISNHILPTNNASYDIGSAEYKIRHLFLSDNSLWIGDEHKIDISDGKMKLKKIKKSDTFIPTGLTDNADLQAAITNRGGTRANYTINDWNIIAKEVGVSNFNEVFKSDNSDNWEEDVEMGGGGGGGGVGTVPIKGIIMWSGTTAEAEALVGWALCIGGTQNGITIPDLRDKFIVGAGSEYSIGATGGAKEVVLSESQMPSHNHSISIDNDTHSHTGSTNETGSHRHQSAISTLGQIVGSVGGPLLYLPPSSSSSLQTSDSGNHTHTVSIDDHAHNHTATIDNSGSGSAHENRPPYYALAYIIRIQ
tara:strand:- start:3920 stop:5080 length:1161 start_codon:yes stop_codon:yes gene_type:complete